MKIFSIPLRLADYFTGKYWTVVEIKVKQKEKEKKEIEVKLLIFYEKN